MGMTAEDRIAELDDRFVQIYEAARRRRIDEQMAHALIVVCDDTMLLYHGGREPKVITGLRPPLYNKLKTLSHVPLAIYCLSAEYCGEPLTGEALAALRDYRDRLAATADDFDTTQERESAVLSRGIDIFNRSMAFLDRVIADGRIADADLATYCRNNAEDFHECFFAATKAELDACHAEIMHLKERVLTAADWASLRVVVMGPHMAHKGNNHLQYFAKLLRTPMYTDKRLDYCESDDLQDALDLAGTAILDFQASRVFFDDENRLHRDVLADATTRYLDELLPGHRS